jgi:hypothetical protein
MDPVQESQQEQGKHRMDDEPTTVQEELHVLRNLVDLLEDLDASARSRLVAYLFDRYNDRSPW